jgi:hypothetical protein
MDWFETVINGVLFVTVIGGLIFERKWTNRINKRLDGMNVKINSASRAATDAKVNSLDAKREARQAKNLVNESQIVIGGHLPDTPHNESLVEALRKAAARVSAKRAHPAGTGRVPGVRRSAVTGRYVTNPVQTTPSGIDYIPVAAAIALTTDTSSSYSSPGTNSTTSTDSGSFGGGDSGSF